MSQLHAVLIVSQLLAVPSRHTRQHSFLPSEGLEQRFLRFVNLFSFLSLHAVSAARNRREHLGKIKESVSLSDRVYEGLERDTVLHTVQDKRKGQSCMGKQSAECGKYDTYRSASPNACAFPFPKPERCSGT